MRPTELRYHRRSSDERFYDPSIGRWTQADPSSYQTAIGTRPDVNAMSTSTLFPSGVKNWTPKAPTCSLSRPQSLNYYTYSNDDPINNVVPSGLGVVMCYVALMAFGVTLAAFREVAPEAIAAAYYGGKFFMSVFGALGVGTAAFYTCGKDLIGGGGGGQE